ncbi:CTP synthase [Pseudoalteromonas luteoviolacea]|uniref:CTP synthase C-terminal region-related (seleno)protein n=1 Tax=Pseudoalteromonas luteoviolacea TaxID=43657 RepID=UPI001B37FC1C|nr:CTP synthase [Pseudoalteromonas luteoviolacea]MBQ4811236.1 CTP synthase [Pseudoalteromonas luteoviolacea]
MKSISIALVGDYDPSVPAHQGIPLSLDVAADDLRLEIKASWLATENVKDTDLSVFDGIWCVPKTPYVNADGALSAIRYARENLIPFLGTCGGFQHAILEYAQNVIGWSDATHAESSPQGQRPVISELACALVETTETVNIFAHSQLAAIYGTTAIKEGYRCRYGLNDEFRHTLLQGPLVASADDETKEVRAVELTVHPFYIATLFQPERAVLSERRSPLIQAFVNACVQNQGL